MILTIDAFFSKAIEVLVANEKKNYLDGICRINVSYKYTFITLISNINMSRSVEYINKRIQYYL